MGKFLYQRGELSTEDLQRAIAQTAPEGIIETIVFSGDKTMRRISPKIPKHKMPQRLLRQPSQRESDRERERDAVPAAKTENSAYLDKTRIQGQGLMEIDGLLYPGSCGKTLLWWSLPDTTPLDEALSQLRRRLFLLTFNHRGMHRCGCHRRGSHRKTAQTFGSADARTRLAGT